MSESTPEKIEKTPEEKLRDVLSLLKEMEHYSRSNIEKLSESWLLLDDELKLKELAAKASDLLGSQNAFHDQVTALSGEIEAECDRLAAEKKE